MKKPNKKRNPIAKQLRHFKRKRTNQTAIRTYENVQQG